LHFFEVPTPLVCLSVLVSNDVHGDDLRLEHTHFWSQDGSTGISSLKFIRAFIDLLGGHYHTDLTPEAIRYEAYYKPAKTLWRIGRALAPK
jgi:hypothetical protein